MLDENEFLSPYGIRALSRHHEANPYVLNVDGAEHRVDYEPGESRTGLFGGNSNWRGPIWFPVNFLLIESLQRFHYYLGDDFKVECPDGLGQISDIVGGGGGAVAPAEQHLHPQRRRPAAGVRRHRASSSTTSTGATSSCSTSTSTATPAPASAPVTRPDGPRWSAKLMQQSGEKNVTTWQTRLRP